MNDFSIYPEGWSEPQTLSRAYYQTVDAGEGDKMHLGEGKKEGVALWY